MSIKEVINNFKCKHNFHSFKQDKTREVRYVYSKCKCCENNNGACEHSKWLYDVVPMECTNCGKDIVRILSRRDIFGPF